MSAMKERMRNNARVLVEYSLTTHIVALSSAPVLISQPLLHCDGEEELRYFDI